MSLRILLILLLIALAKMGFASTSSGKIDTYWVLQTEKVFIFKLNGAINDKPICNSLDRYAVPLTTESGLAIKDTIVNAKANQLDVVLRGKNTCSIWGDSEDINYVGMSGVPSKNISNLPTTPAINPVVFAVCIPGFHGNDAPFYDHTPVNATCSCGNGTLIAQNIGRDACSVTSNTASCSVTTKSSGGSIDRFVYGSSACCLCKS